MKTLLERYGESWRAAGRDITLISVSILIAFTLEAWWGSLLDRRADEAQLRRLHGELVAAQRSLDVFSEGLEQAGASTRALLQLMDPDAAAPSADTLVLLFRGSFNVGFADLRRSVAAEVLATRNPLLASRASLTTSLEDWSTLIVDLSLDAGHLERNRDVDIQGALVAAGFPGFAVAAAGPLGLPSPTFPLETAPVVRSTELYAAFYYRAFRLRVMALSVDRLRELAENIVVELEGIVAGMLANKRLLLTR